MKITATQVKGDIQFLVAVGLALGLPLSNALTYALLGASALIAAAVNLADAHIHAGKATAAALADVKAEIHNLLPAAATLAADLPGHAAGQIEQILSDLEGQPAPAPSAPAPVAVLKKIAALVPPGVLAAPAAPPAVPEPAAAPEPKPEPAVAEAAVPEPPTP